MASLRWHSVRSVAHAARVASEPGSAPWGVRLAAVPRLLRSVADRSYGGLTRGRLLLMVVAAAYVVAPLDLVPEGLVGLIGLTDDAVAIAWLAGALAHETQAFLDWERAGGSVRSHVV